jgi:hypothetical protein
MELLIYSPDIILLGILDTWHDIIWHRRATTSGDFEIHAPITTQNQALCQVDNLVVKPGAVEFGIIESLELNEEDQHQTLIVRGRFGSSLLARRIIDHETKLNTTVEVAMRTLVYENLIHPTNPDRVMPHLVLGSLMGYTPNISYQVTYKNLLTTCRELAEASGLGFRCRLDPSAKSIVFEVTDGVDRTALQSANPRCLFSADTESLVNATYAKSSQDHLNVALVGGEGVGEERTLVLVGNGTGLARREVFVNAKDQRRDDQSLAEYQARLSTKGQLALSNVLEHFEGEVMTLGSFRYRQDYDLGDWVTITHSKWNQQAHVQITEITEVYDDQGVRIIPTFGKSQRSITQSPDTSEVPLKEVITYSPSKVLVSDPQGVPQASTITTSELSALAGIQSTIQSQINAIWQRIYPVGSLYLSKVSTDPATLFGGVWQRIEDRFVLAAGTTYPAGSSGGNAAHTHTSAAHSHTVAAHTHTSAPHTHSVNAHSHSSAAHTHSLTSHSHTLAAGFAMLRASTGYLYLRQATSTSWIDNQKISGTVSTSSITQGTAVELGGETDDTALTTNSTTPANTGTTSLNTNSTTPADTGSTALTTDSTTPGSTGSTAHLPPYLAVYVFKRTA